MSSQPKAAPNLDRTDSCVAKQQRAVYNYYESQHSDNEVVDIYSSEWKERITSWHKMFAQAYGTKHARKDVVKTWETPEEIDFSTFFFAHPIAAFSLWKVFQAFYGIDQAVCGTSSDAPQILAKWKEMKPFEYLKSKEVRKAWKRELKKLNKEIEVEDLNVTSRVYGILRGLETLEMAMSLLETDFRINQAEIEQWILDKMRHAVNDRCLLIAKKLTAGTDDQAKLEESISSLGKRYALLE
jgi:hypothetical protein